MTPTVRLLGGVQVFDGAQWHLPPSHKPIGLLGYLACQGGWVERERLAFLFWPDAERERARTNLRGLIARARELPFVRDFDAEPSRVRWRVQSDVRAFREAVDAAAWADAISHYGGELLQGMVLDDATEFASWLELERADLKRAYRDAVFHRAEELRSAGRTAEAVTLLGGLLADDDPDEEALQRSMRLLAERGEPEHALHLYRSFRRRLDETLGLEPTPATERLAHRIASEPTDPLPAGREGGSASVAPRPHPDRSGRRKPLPAPLGSFVGRDRELALLAQRLAEPECRLLTIVGTAGVGKTRLALQAARGLAERYPDGALFVPLDATGSVEGVPLDIAGALGIDIDPARAEDPLAQVTRALKDRSLLLVLDNYEHLVGGAATVAELLRSCPGLTLLVTSRERLDLAEEWLLPLQGLAYPEAEVPLREAQAYDSVRIFVERAEQIQPGFRLDAVALPGVLRICRLVAGLPLGIELAAAWVHALPVSDIADEIEGNLDLLSRRGRSSGERHGSIRAAFENSWRRLTPEAQEVLRRLAVFRGGFRREAATRVASTSIAFLAALVDKSLLRVSRDGRYDRHPLLHQYTLEKLRRNPAEEADARERHARYFASLLEEADPHLGTPRQQEWLQRLHAERDNLRDALGWAVENARADLALRLVASLRWLWWPSGDVHERRELLTRLLSLPDTSRTPARAGALHIAGVLAHGQGDFDEARSLYEAALDIAQENGTPAIVVKLLGNLAHIARIRGEPEASRALLERCLSMRHEVGDHAFIASALNHLATIARFEGNHAEARSLHEQGLAIGRRLSDDLTIAQSLNGLAYLAQDRGDAAEARSLLEESLSVSRGAGFPLSVAASLDALAREAHDRGDHARARALHGESLSVQWEHGMLRRLDGSLAGIAALKASEGEPEKAARIWGAVEAFREARSTRPPPDERARQEEALAAARARLGEERFDAARAQGRAMDLPQAVAYALDAVGFAGGPESAPAR